MRLNFFKYHVQDRNYSRAEILSLINEKPYKHLTLSGSEFFYSSGTVAESLECIATPVTYILKSAGSFAWNMTVGLAYSGIVSIFVGDPGVTIINNTNNHYNSLYKITDIPNDKFTGHEVAKFMNEYYDYSPHFNKEVYYDNIISNFLNHSFKDAEVPTLGNAGWFDIAVLDSYS